MSRFIASICNDDSLTSHALNQLSATMQLPSTVGSSGYGVGWIHRGQSLLRTTPKPTPTGPELVDLLADIRTRAVLGVVREAGEGNVEPLELQPFRFRRWVFAHAGEEPAHEALAGLSAQMPRLVSSNVKGSCAGEVFGHVFLGELHRRNILEAEGTPSAHGAALAQAVRDIQLEAAVAELGLVVVTSKSLVAATVAEPLYYRLQRGLKVREEALFAGHKVKTKDHPTFKSVTVTNAEVDDGEWERIPDGHVMWVERDWTVQFAPISEA